MIVYLNRTKRLLKSDEYICTYFNTLKNKYINYGKYKNNKIDFFNYKVVKKNFTIKKEPFYELKITNYNLIFYLYNNTIKIVYNNKVKFLYFFKNKNNGFLKSNKNILILDKDNIPIIYVGKIGKNNFKININNTNFNNFFNYLKINQAYNIYISLIIVLLCFNI
jgi:hypothetical protein